jgi:hypothetical protein
VVRLLTLAVIAVVVSVTAGAAAMAASAPADLVNNHESGDGKPLVSGVTYGATLFPLKIRFTATDQLWEGAQFVRTAGLHEGQQRKGGKFAFITLLHKYGHNAQGKVSNWGRGTIVLEAGVAPGDSVQATMTRLRARLSDFQRQSGVSKVSVAGFSGLSYDGRLRDGNGSTHRFVPFSSSDGSQATTDSRKIETNYGKGEAFRIMVLDIRGKPVVVYLEGETAPPDKFPAFLAFANRLLRTLTVG